MVAQCTDQQADSDNAVVVIMTAAKTVSRGSDAVSGPPDSMMLSEPKGSPTPTRSRSAGWQATVPTPLR